MTVHIDDEVELRDEDIVNAESFVDESGSRDRWTRHAGIALALTAMVLAAVVGYLKWQDDSARSARAAAAEAIRVAGEGTVALLSYRAESVDADLKGVTDRLAGDFRGQYIHVVDTVVAPGAKQRHISAAAKVAGAAAVSADENHAAVLVFVDQTTTIGNGTPTASTSSVRVTLDKVQGRWLISQFDPV